MSPFLRAGGLEDVQTIGGLDEVRACLSLLPAGGIKGPGPTATREEWNVGPFLKVGSGGALE